MKTCPVRSTGSAIYCRAGGSCISRANRDWTPRKPCTASSIWRPLSCRFCADVPAVLRRHRPGHLPGWRHDVGRVGGGGRARRPRALSPRHRRSSGGQRQAFSAGGGCITIDQHELAGPLDDQLADMLCFLLANDGLRRQMSAAMREMARPHAAEDVAELIWSIVSSRAIRAELAAA